LTGAVVLDGDDEQHHQTDDGEGGTGEVGQAVDGLTQ